ncbi:MAG: TusE/DsrC/DsvC family sulfur relay protein [Desulfobacterales bacterium]|nr:TusE/DsrC/DsvC family sulfur relay protein [Desulfobacterales bacterium]
MARRYHSLNLDSQGYLRNLGDWDEEVACTLAEMEGVSDQCPLEGERMEILKYMRAYYRKFEAFPIVRAVCKNLGQDRHCQYEQFPDPITAWKIAGLPRPTPEVLAKIKH